MPTEGLSYEETLHMLLELRELSEQQRIIVVGGQAVALWYRQLHAQGYLSGDELETLSSKDIDFRAASQTVRQVAALLRGEARLPTIDDHTPSTGLVLIPQPNGRTRQIDFIDAPYGLRARDVIETAQRVILVDGHDEVPVTVIHPQRLMESRVHNVIGLKQNGAHSLRQARAAISCAAAFSCLLLDAHEVSEHERIRAVLKLNERTYRFCRRAVARAFVRETGLDPFDAVLADNDDLPERFRTVRYPQMQTLLERLRRE